MRKFDDDTVFLALFVAAVAVAAFIGGAAGAALALSWFPCAG